MNASSTESRSAGPRVFCGDLRPFAHLTKNPRVSATNRRSPALQLALEPGAIFRRKTGYWLRGARLH